jgi:hypothetical protein
MRTLLFGCVAQCAILTARCQEPKFSAASDEYISPFQSIISSNRHPSQTLKYSTVDILQIHTGRRRSILA